MRYALAGSPTRRRVVVALWRSMYYSIPAHDDVKACGDEVVCASSKRHNTRAQVEPSGGGHEPEQAHELFHRLC